MSRSLQSSPIVLFILFAASACGSSAASEPEDVPEIEGQALSAAEGARAARQAEVDAFVAARTQGWRIAETRATTSGQIVDYVTADTLYPDSPDAPFAAPPPIRAERAETLEEGITDFQLDASLAPPRGTIAVIRPNLDAYVNGATGARNLGELFGKEPASSAQAGETAAGAVSFANNRLYGVHQDTRSNIGTRGAINLWNTRQVGSQEMSLLQAASACFGPKSNPNATDTIEAGFQKNPLLYGDSLVHAFTYFTTVGYMKEADRVGGYNRVYQGFVQAVGAPFPPGAAMAANSFSILGGAQRECRVETELFQGNWWVMMCGSWLGYYPTKSSTSVAASQRIDFDLMGSGACVSSWYGEVADPTPTTWTKADMGSGFFPGEGFAAAAYIREPAVKLTASSSDWLSSSVPGNGPGYDTDCYQVSDIMTSAPPFTRWFLVGGPGGDSIHCK